MKPLSTALILALLGGGAVAAAQRTTIPSGTEIAVRTDQAINAASDTPRTSPTSTGRVSQDVLDRDGNVRIPRGSAAQLAAMRDGDNLALDLRSVTVHGRR